MRSRSFQATEAELERIAEIIEKMPYLEEDKESLCLFRFKVICPGERRIIARNKINSRNSFALIIQEFKNEEMQCEVQMVISGIMSSVDKFEGL